MTCSGPAYRSADPRGDEGVRRYFERDDYTCQRCGRRGGPHGDERPLHVHYAHWQSSQGAGDHENHLTVCHSCHAALHPEAGGYDGVRGHADLYPAPRADPRVAVVNGRETNEPVDAFLARISRGTGWVGTWLDWLPRPDSRPCRRCRNRFGTDDLVVFPSFDPDETTHPADDCDVVCRPCAGLLLADAAEEDEASGTVREDAPDADTAEPPALPAPILDLDGDVVDPTRLTELTDRAKVSSASAALLARREPVNRKERTLQTPPASWIHGLWSLFATVGLTGLSLYALRDAFPPAIRTAAQALSLDGMTGNAATAVVFVLAIALAFAVSTGATAVRWSVTWLSGALWRLLDPTVEPTHFRRQAFWNWWATTTNWAFLYGVLLLLPVAVPLLFVHGILSNPSKTDGRVGGGSPGRSKNWAKTAAWYTFYRW